MTKTEELMALADELDGRTYDEQGPIAKAAAALREYAATMDAKPVSQTVPDNDCVICPGCAHQFRAIPVNVQAQLRRQREQLEAPTTQEPVAWIGPYKSAWDALNELRKSCADIIGTDPKTWPNHGNVPLAIAVTLAIARTHMEQGTHPPAPTAQKVCHGIPRIGCNYLAECETICNKCGQIHAVQFIPLEQVEGEL